MFKALVSVGGMVGNGQPTASIATNGNVLYRYKYRVIDQYFNEEWYDFCDQRVNYAEVRAGAIVACYEAKRLNVAFNLALYHRWMEENFYWYGRAGYEVQYNTEHTVGYGEYAPKVREYLSRFGNLKTFW